ncbi:Rossmann fold nucleotide-binding protein [Nocardioides seonyuensis]|uniref:Rossmann fold nucleotide-binding protein n=1 Tax=Nocardioides seonyuensis TaxID=2518371 RepID=A0A4P7ICA8_9ACTN|nr:LOG family protein [Nocardioides seonyuensis]QBX54153.1 Rossmann fold nucleotide-binding protein [Nocardioides seonyuensis]
MKSNRGRVVDITSLADLDRHLAAGARSLAGWRLIGLDLTHHGKALQERSVAQALFLGCTFAPGDGEVVRRAGAVVLPKIPDTPVDPYRARLYSPRELYDAEHYRDTLDARAYAWSQGAVETDDELAMALHDHALDGALTAWVDGRSIVGVMGGHALARGSAGYDDAARLGHALGSRLTVATGGGPGAMEAANLGAWLSGESAATLTDALAAVAAVPSFEPDVGAWARAALALVDARTGTDTLGIPTWHYGHEPPNPFATAIAKYFKNATREAILLQVCNAGIVFLPGAAGTVQEVFQDACENYYADPASIAPMVLVGRTHWTETVPAWPLLHTLARDRAMESHVHLVDSVDEAVALFS